MDEYSPASAVCDVLALFSWVGDTKRARSPERAEPTCNPANASSLTASSQTSFSASKSTIFWVK